MLNVIPGIQDELDKGGKMNGYIKELMDEHGKMLTLK